MGNKAAGKYLWELRKYQQLSRDELAKAFGTSRSQIERVELGKGEVAASLLLGITQHLNGDVRVVTELLLNPDATEDTGYERAKERTIQDTSVKDERGIIQRLQWLEEQVRNLKRG